jgi:hypothetical protein
VDNKKIGMIAFAVIAFIVAAGVIFWTIQSQQLQIVKTVDGGTGTNPKVQFMNAQKEAQQGKEGAPGKEEKDPNAVGDK